MTQATSPAIFCSSNFLSRVVSLLLFQWMRKWSGMRKTFRGERDVLHPLVSMDAAPTPGVDYVLFSKDILVGYSCYDQRSSRPWLPKLEKLLLHLRCLRSFIIIPITIITCVKGDPVVWTDMHPLSFPSGRRLRQQHLVKDLVRTFHWKEGSGSFWSPLDQHLLWQPDVLIALPSFHPTW